MFAAAVAGDGELVTYYLQRGVDPNYQHPEFMTTVLNAAIEQAQRDIVCLLLAYGADPRVRAHADHRTAFEVAEEHCQPEIWSLLGGVALR